jgi:hypothetical protein
MLKFINGPPALPQDYQAGDLIYSEDQTVFESFKLQFDQKGYPCAWIGDCHPICPFNEIKYYYLPTALHVYVNSFFKSWPPPVDINNIITDKCFNFLIRSPRLGRYFTVKLVEMFNLTSMFYTVSQDTKNLKTRKYIETLEPTVDAEYNTFLQHIKSNLEIQLEANFYPDSVPRDRYARVPTARNWNNILKSNCQTTAVSLITETSDHLDLPHFTEKTLFAMDALTFPIWVGGYQSAAEWQKYGFDIFEDIVDHSYQNYKTLPERCFYAIKNNLELLTNLELVKQLRQRHFSRLVNNRNNLKRNIQNVYQTQWKKIPRDYRDQIKFLVEKSEAIHNSGIPDLSIVGPDRPNGNSNWYNYDSSHVLLTFNQPDIGRIEKKIKQFGNPRAWVNTCYVDCPLKNLDHYYYLPVFLKLLAEKFVVCVDPAPWQNSQYCFNFISNRPRINRYLLLRLINWFDLKSYNYTSNFKGEPMALGTICDDFDRPTFDCVDRNKFKTYILDPSQTEIPEKFYLVPQISDQSRKMDHMDQTVINCLDWTVNWNVLLKPIFLSSVTSLITESGDEYNLSQFTEKTIYAMNGLTFPIWVGGYRLAEYWKEYGFDIFEDIIDHSYQHSGSLLERCFLAIKLNERLLKDLDYANELKQQMKQRLISNQTNMMKFIQTYYDQQWNKIPKQVQDLIYGELETVYTFRPDI